MVRLLNQHPNTSLLTSPMLTISRAGYVEVTFVRSGTRGALGRRPVARQR
jgi:hypothetical protein